VSEEASAHYNTLQHTATHCNTLQYTATHCNTLQQTATQCNTPCERVRIPHTQLQHTAKHNHTLQHTATHCNTLQHTATHRVSEYASAHPTATTRLPTTASCRCVGCENSHMTPHSIIHTMFGHPTRTVHITVRTPYTYRTHNCQTQP